MIGFIDTLDIQLGTTGNYSAIPISTHSRVVSLHKSYPGNGFITVSLSPHITHEVIFSQPSSFLAIILQLPIPKTRLNSIPSSYPGRLASRNTTQLFPTELFFITTLHGPQRKHSLSTVGKACLQRRCTATEVTRLLLAYSLPQQYVYRVVA
jgi:hypothetical protein